MLKQAENQNEGYRATVAHNGKVMWQEWTGADKSQATSLWDVGLGNRRTG